MPTTAKTLAKANMRKSKSSARPKKANATQTKNRKAKKRNAVSSDDDEGEEDDDSSADSETPKKKKVLKKILKKVLKRVSKWRHVDQTDDDVEMIDEDVGEETVEEVDAEGSEQMVCTDFYWEMCILTTLQDDGLNEHQRGPELEEKPVKKDLTCDLLTIMSDKVTMKFKIGTDKFVTDRGRWCNLCK